MLTLRPGVFPAHMRPVTSQLTLRPVCSQLTYFPAHVATTRDLRTPAAISCTRRFVLLGVPDAAGVVASDWAATPGQVDALMHCCEGFDAASPLSEGGARGYAGGGGGRSGGGLARYARSPASSPMGSPKAPPAAPAAPAAAARRRSRSGGKVAATRELRAAAERLELASLENRIQEVGASLVDLGKSMLGGGGDRGGGDGGARRRRNNKK